MKFRYLLLIAAAFAACTKNAPEPVESLDNAQVQFRALTGQTRASFATDAENALSISWEIGDLIGVSSCQGEEIVGVNYPYGIKDEENTLEPSSSLYTFKKSSQERTYYAYYPYAGEAGAGVHYIAPMSLPSEQKFDAREPLKYLSEYWVMKAAPYSVTSASQTVDFSFSGVFSIIELKLVYSKAAAKNYPLEKVSMKSEGAPMAIAQGNLNLTTTDKSQDLIINTPVDSVALIMDAAVTLSESEAKTFYLVVAPGQHQGVSLELVSNNSYKAQIQIEGTVTFAPNTVYHKTVTVDPDTFQWFAQNEGDVQPTRTVYAPVATVEEIVDGEYIIGFLHKDGDYYVLPTAPVDRNPAMVSFEAASVESDAQSNILSVADGYEWIVDNTGSEWTFKTADGNFLVGGNKAQGIAISNNKTGYYTTRENITYYEKWILTTLDNGNITMCPVSVSRYFTLLKDNSRYQFGTQAEVTGTLVFYKKTEIAE